MAENVTSPWLLIGDLHLTLDASENKGGNPYNPSPIQPIKDITENSGLVDIGFRGPPFTWNNKQKAEKNIQARLDRGLANPDWINLLPQVTTDHLPAIGSDHSPLLLLSYPPDFSFATPYRFFSLWL